MDFVVLEMPLAKDIYFENKEKREIIEICYCSLYIQEKITFYQALTLLETDSENFLELLKKYNFTLSKKHRLGKNKSLIQGERKLIEFNQFIEDFKKSNNLTFYSNNKYLKKEDLENNYSFKLFRKEFLVEGKTLKRLRAAIDEVNKEFPDEFELCIAGDTYDLCLSISLRFYHKIETSRDDLKYVQFFDKLSKKYLKKHSFGVNLFTIKKL